MIKKISTCLLALLWLPMAIAQRQAIGNLLTENIPALDPLVSETWEQYQYVRNANFADWDASGKGMFISTRFGDVAQIHHVAAPLADRQQITFFKEPINSVNVRPAVSGEKGFLFSRDIGGNENYQIFYFDQKTGKISLLTDGKSRNGDAQWNKKGDKIVYSSTARTGRDVDFYLKAMDGSPARMILENKGGGWNILDWSADESRLMVRNGISINESKWYMLDVKSGKLEELNPSTKQIAYGGAIFTPDGKGCFYRSDEDSEFSVLRFYDFASKKSSKIAEMNWDIEAFELSDNGAMLAFTTNEAGLYKLFLLDVKTRKYKPVNVQLPQGVFSNLKFNKDNRRLALNITTASTPNDVFVIDLKTNQLKQWTQSETGGMPVSKFANCRLVEFPTFDKDDKTGKPRTIQAFLYEPKNAAAKLPVIIDIHGGPEGQAFPNFTARRQFWATEMGLAVMVPNVRGSSGYGKTYLKLDNAELRENSVKDIGALLDWIAQQPNLDANRVAVMGQSYGGYMSLACMTHYNDRLRCGIDFYGISNFVSFLKNTSGYRADLRRVEYGDERNPDMAATLEKISPLTNIKKITKPMFIFQGENDPRVPLSESEQMLEALKANGVTAWYVRAKDEGHGITKKANSDYVYSAVALFLKQFLVD